MTDVERLRQAIRDLHGLDAKHLRSDSVHERFRGKTVWEGVVEMFEITDHPTTLRAYAWAHETDTGGRRYVAVLGIDPIKTAGDAVRAAVVAEGGHERGK